MLIFGKNVLYEIDLKKIKKVYIARRDYVSYLTENKIKYEFVDNKRLDKMVSGNHQGIVIDIHDYDYYKLEDVEGDFIVMLDHLTDPHNFGAIIRSCACRGIKTIIIPKDRSVSINETVMKVSEGTLDKVKIVMVNNLVNAINDLKKENYFIYASAMDGISYKEVDASGKKVLIIGNEGKGVSDLVRKNADFIVKIPMNSTVDSLNASVAAGILIFGLED